HAAVVHHHELVLSEIVDVEGAGPGRSFNLVPIEVPVLTKHQFAKFVVREKRLRPVEAYELGPVEPNRAQNRKTPPTAGDLATAHPLTVHGKIEDTTRGSIGMIESQAGLVEPYL